LFHIALKYAVRQLSIDVNLLVFYKSGKIVDHADDINIMERSTQTDGKIYIERARGTHQDNGTLV
jgi:hypothetical protein